MIILKSLKVEGFRAFTQEHDFTFEKPATFLFGENHVGKSSTLNAIEWCLFGNECIGSSTGIRERIKFEIPNRNVKPTNASTMLILEDTNNTYKIFREWKSATRDELKITLSDGNTLEGVEAKKELAQIINSSFRDFLTTVYQHQEALRALLTQEPSNRNDAIDRLLGLSEYRNVISGIDAARLHLKLKKMGEGSDMINREIGATMNAIDVILKDRKEKAINQGLKEEQISEIGGLKLGSEAIEKLTKFSSETGLLILDFQTPESLDDLVSFIKLIRNEIKRFRAEMPDVKKQQELYKRRADFTALKLRYQSEKESLDGLNTRLNEFLKEHGDEKSLEKKKLELEKKIQEKEIELGEVNAKAASLRHAIHYLKLGKVDKEICPVCGKKTENLVEHLQEEWEKKYKSQVAKIQNYLDRFNEQLTATKKLISEIQDRNNYIRNARKSLEEKTQEIAKFIEMELKQEDDPFTFIQKKLEALENELESLRMAVESKQDTLNKIDSSIENVELICDIISEERHKKIVEKLQQSKEYKQMEEQKTQMAFLVDDINKIKEAVTAASHMEAKQKVDSAGRIIDKYFKAIANNPSISRLDFLVETDPKGQNSYKFLDENGEELNPILSQGDLNALALSIFLGMNNVQGIDKPFGFIMMDDPSQSMGSEHKEKFVGVLNEVLEQSYIILSTMDKELQDLLDNNVTKLKRKYIFVDWTPDNGPQVIIQ